MADNWKCPEDRFPMMGPGYPRVGEQRFTVPLAFVLAHESGALRNHGQSVARLKERGGLAWAELADIIAGFKWGARKWPLDMAHEYVIHALFKWRRENPAPVQQALSGRNGGEADCVADQKAVP